VEVVSIKDKVITIQVVTVLFRNQPTKELLHLISKTKEGRHIHLHKTRIRHKAVATAHRLPSHIMAETTMPLLQAAILHKDMIIRNNSTSAIILLTLHKEVTHLTQQKVAIRPTHPRVAATLHQLMEAKTPTRLMLPALKDPKVPMANVASVRQPWAPWEVAFLAIKWVAMVL